MDLVSADRLGVTVSGALAAGVVPAPVTSVLVVLVTAPGVAEVSATTIVQPPGGILVPLAIVISVGVTVTPVQVPVFPDVVVTPAGMGSVNAAVNDCATALTLPIVSVSVAEPPDTMVAGEIVLASVSGAAVTVSGALAAGVVPAPVTTVLVVLVTAPGVVDVSVTMIVQPPGGMLEPPANVISAGVTVTPEHVPLLAEVVVTPAGIGSVNGAVNVCATAFALARVSVSVAVPPAAMVAGEIVLASPSVAAVTVSGALAAGTVPPAVWIVLVVLVTAPGVLDVIVTTIVHPPTGTGDPDAIVISVGVTVTPVQLPTLAPVVVTPAGIGSVKFAVSVVPAALELPMFIVNVAEPPATIDAGAIDLASVSGASFTVSGALAAGVVPAPVLSVLVVLVTVPGRLDVMVTIIVQPPGGMSEPDAIVISVGVTLIPAHVPALADVVVTPAGIGSVKFALSACDVALAFPSVRVSVDVPPAVIVPGTMVLASVATTAFTVSGAVAAGAAPVSVCRALVVFVTLPGVVEVIVTMMVQPPAGMLAPPASVSSVGATLTPTHVPVLADVMVTPGGIGSVNAAVSVVVIALGLPSVSVSVALPPTAMVAGAMDLPSVGGSTVTVNGALAAGAVPNPVCSALVVLVTGPGVEEVIVTMIVQPPAGRLAPLAIVICVAVTVTPVHVPVLAPVVVTPAGIVSVNGDVSVVPAALVLPSVSVSVALPPAAIEAGAMVLASVGADAVTVSGALAAGAVPTADCSALVVLVTVPGVFDVTVTTIVQPPAGRMLPEGLVIDVAVTVIPVHVPVLPPVVVTPAGMLSTNANANVVAPALGLPSASVSVAVPPAAIDAGAIVLPSVGANRTIVLVSDAEAVEPGPELAALTAVTVFVIDGADMPALKVTGNE